VDNCFRGTARTHHKINRSGLNFQPSEKPRLTIMRLTKIKWAIFIAAPICIFLFKNSDNLYCNFIGYDLIFDFKYKKIDLTEYIDSVVCNDGFVEIVMNRNGVHVIGDSIEPLQDKTVKIIYGPHSSLSTFMISDNFSVSKIYIPMQ